MNGTPESFAWQEAERHYLERAKIRDALLPLRGQGDDATMAELQLDEAELDACLALENMLELPAANIQQLRIKMESIVREFGGTDIFDADLIRGILDDVRRLSDDH